MVLIRYLAYYGWRTLSTSFSEAFVNLYNFFTALARHLATKAVDPIELMAFVACRLTSLDKQLSV